MTTTVKATQEHPPFVQVQVSAHSAVGGLHGADCYVIGLTATGDVYSWRGHERGWERLGVAVK